MVHSVIISDLNCQILYSCVFDFNQSSFGVSNMQKIIKRIKAVFDFNFAVSNSTNLDISHSSMLDFETKGVTNVKVNDICKTAVYHSFCGCLYVLLCDNTDNRLLAFRTLVLLIRTLRDVMPKMTSFTSQFVVRADAVSMTVNSFIPSGQLLFLHDQAVQQMSRDLQKSLR